MQNVFTANEIDEIRQEARQEGYMDGYETGFSAGQLDGVDFVCVGKVINNNQPGWQNIIETAPNCTLDIGTRVYIGVVQRNPRPEPSCEVGQVLDSDGAPTARDYVFW